MDLHLSDELALVTASSGGIGFEIAHSLATEGCDATLRAFTEEVFPEASPVAAERRFIQENRPTSLIARLIEPVELGDVVAFVATPLASAINGAALRVDGGLIRRVI